MQYIKSRFSLLLLLIISVIAAVFIQLPSSSLLSRSIQNFLHIPLFVAISLLAISLLSIKIGNKRLLYLATLILSLSIGVGIELLQGLTQRPFDLMDVSRDLIGIIMGLMIYAGYKRKLRWSLISVIVVVFLYRDAYLLVNLSWNYYQRQQAFPVLLDLQQNWVDPFINLRLLEREGEVLTFLPGNYPGLSLLEPYPDWRGFDSLELVIVNHQSALFSPVIRVHDQYFNHTANDLFIKTLPLQPGENLLQIPIESIRSGPRSRQLDLANIAGVIVYFPRLDNPVTLELKDIKLK